MLTKENIMGTKKIIPLLLSMSIPPIISMLIQSLYNIVDSIFVAKISTDALTAVSLAFPLQNLALSVAVGLGVGLNACIAQSLGAKDQLRTDAVATHGFIYAIIHSLLFVVLGLVVTAPFLKSFNQSSEIYQMSCTYSYIVICGSFGMHLHIYVEKLFQAIGNMIVPMLLQGLGAIINIILDPLLIFGLWGFPKLGVAGAAIATVIAQITACIASFIIFFCKNSGIHIKFKGFRLSGEITKNIYIIALPSAIMMALPSLLVSILNKILIGLNELAVAVFGIYYKVQTFIYMPASGVIQGIRPVISYNYGAKIYDRTKATIKAAVLFISVIMAIGTALFLAFPKGIISLFDTTPAILALGVPAFRIISIGFILSSASLVFAAMFESLGRGIHSLIISLTRIIIIIPPLAYLLSRFWGLNGVWIAFPIAELIAAIVSFVLYKVSARKIFKLEP